MAAASWRQSMAPLLERRIGPRKVALEPQRRAGDAVEPGARRRQRPGPARDAFVRSTSDPAPLPASDADIAFAPVTQLSRWIERKAAHLRAADEHLSAPDRAVRSEAALRHHAHEGRRARAGEAGRRGDRRREVSRAAARHSVRREGSARHGGHRRRPTAPSRSGTACRPPTAAVVQRLNDAGAVLVAKLSLGALALNDIWFGGQTMNPWLLEEGASGSSAGPGAATAAALVGFSIGSETGGSIVAPGDALRRDRTAPDVRARAAHRRDDALLVARQARPDDAQRRGRDARAAGDHRARRGRCRRACRAISTSTRPRRRPGCASATSRRG